MTDSSPLLTASPEALTALFEADPLTLSDDAIMALILELRRRRNAFTAEEAAQFHVQPGATAVGSQRIFDWIDSHWQ